MNPGGLDSLSPSFLLNNMLQAARPSWGSRCSIVGSHTRGGVVP